jgi:hypothetical protein
VPVAVVLIRIQLHFLGQGVGDDVVADVHQLGPLDQPAGRVGRWVGGGW